MTPREAIEADKRRLKRTWPASLYMDGYLAGLEFALSNAPTPTIPDREKSDPNAPKVTERERTDAGNWVCSEHNKLNHECEEE